MNTTKQVIRAMTALGGRGVKFRKFDKNLLFDVYFRINGQWVAVDRLTILMNQISK